MCVTLVSAVLFFSCTQTSSGQLDSFSYQKDADWTLMFYMAGDNSLDSSLAANVQQMMAGYAGGVNAVLLADRNANATSTVAFGEAFSDTRMYLVTQNHLERLYGDSSFPELAEGVSYEADTGDASVLRKFIRYCKKNYPASYYGLIIGSHGGGVQTGSQIQSRAVVVDATSDNDWLFTAELTDVLELSDSVDVLGLDACYMANVEFAYQLSNMAAFHASYIAASPAEEWSAGWNYTPLLRCFASSVPSPADFASSLVDDYEAYTAAAGTSASKKQTLTCIDTSKLPVLKTSFDSLAAMLAGYQTETENLRGTGALVQSSELFYFNSTAIVPGWLQYPYFDLYSFALRMAADQDYPDTIRNAASSVAAAADDAVVSSFAGAYYSSSLAVPDVAGLSFFFPDGSRLYKSYPSWAYQTWYTALPVYESSGGKYYGNLAFCKDGAVSGDGTAENWFELLDVWYDNVSVRSEDQGGYNGYIP